MLGRSLAICAAVMALVAFPAGTAHAQLPATGGIGEAVTALTETQVDKAAVIFPCVDRGGLLYEECQALIGNISCGAAVPCDEVFEAIEYLLVPPNTTCPVGGGPVDVGCVNNVVDVVNDLVGAPACPIGGGAVDVQCVSNVLDFVADLASMPCPAGGGAVDVACVDRVLTSLQPEVGVLDGVGVSATLAVMPDLTEEAELALAGTRIPMAAVAADTNLPLDELATDGQIRDARASGGCTASGSKDNLVVYEPWRTSGTWKDKKSRKNVFYWQWYYQAHKRNHARSLYDYSANETYSTKQFALCSVGGAKKYGDYRLDRVHSAFTIDDTQPRLIPNKGIWDSGSPSDGKAASTVSFAVSAGPVSVGASLPIHAEGSLGGGIGPDDKHQTSFAAWYDNTVTAFWRGSGSANFEGNVGHAIYEYRQSERPKNPVWRTEEAVFYKCKFLGDC